MNYAPTRSRTVPWWITKTSRVRKYDCSKAMMTHANDNLSFNQSINGQGRSSRQSINQSINQWTRQIIKTINQSINRSTVAWTIQNRCEVARILGRSRQSINGLTKFKPQSGVAHHAYSEAKNVQHHFNQRHHSRSSLIPLYNKGVKRYSHHKNEQKKRKKTDF